MIKTEDSEQKIDINNSFYVKIQSEIARKSQNVHLRRAQNYFISINRNYANCKNGNLETKKILQTNLLRNN